MEIECSGSGGFGIFFSNQQLITLLKHILKDNINILNYHEQKVNVDNEFKLSKMIAVSGTKIKKEDIIKNIISRGCGAKLLRHIDDYNDETKGLTAAVNFMGIKYVETRKNNVFGFGLVANKKITFSYKDGNYRGIFNSKAMYFILMDTLVDAKKYMLRKFTNQPEKNKVKVEEYNEQCVKLIIGPLINQLNKMNESNIYHRDIKPDNIMLQPSKDGKELKATFIDYGMLNKDLTIDGGTLYYMSPAYKMFSENDKNNLKDLEEFYSNDEIFKKEKIRHYIHNMNLFSLENVYKAISWASFYNTNKDYIFNKASDKAKYISKAKYILETHDKYTLGLSIQELCRPLFPECTTSKSIYEKSLVYYLKYGNIDKDDLNKKITQYNNSDNNYDSVINTIMSLRKLQPLPIPKPQIVGGSKKKKRSIHPFLIF